ncbi:MAG: translocation/assembly module TamB domain-containing protein [Proteobacteria bacterium]|nr:translocation/assembly module TamB domain-containing protein [Pseudomonadota bacterium]
MHFKSMQESDKPSEAGRPRRPWVRRALLALAGALLLVGVALVLLLSPAGGDLLASALASLTREQAPYRLSLRQLDLDWGGGIRAAGLELSDANGPWLVAEDLRLSVSLSDLLRWRLNLAEVRAGAVRLLRLPEAGTPPEEEAFGEGRDSLVPPVGRIAALLVSRLELDPAVAGTALSYGLEGLYDCSVDGLQTRLQVQGQGETSGRLTASVDWDRPGDALRLRLELDDPEGGLALLASLPRTPAQASVALEGPLAALGGDIRIEAGKVGLLKAAVRSLPGQSLPFMKLDGSLSFQPGFLPGTVEELAGRDYALRAELGLEAEGLLRLRQLGLDFAGGSASLAGTYQLADGALGLDGTLTAVSGQRLAALTGLDVQGLSALRLSALGNSETIRFEATAGVAGLRREGFGLQGPAFKVSGTVWPLASAAVSLDAEWTGAEVSGLALGAGRLVVDLVSAPGGAEFRDLSLSQPGEGLQLSGQGRISEAQLQAVLSLKTDGLSFAGIPPSLDMGTLVKADLLWMFAEPTGSARLTAELTPKATAASSLLAVMGKTASVEAGLSYGQGALRLDRLALVASDNRAEGQGSWDIVKETGTVDLDLTLQKLTIPMDSRAALLRAVRIGLRATGRPDAFQMQAEAQVGQGTLAGVQVRNLDLRAEAKRSLGPVSLSFNGQGDLVFGEQLPGQPRQEVLRAQAQGKLSLPLSGDVARGQLDLTLGDVQEPSGSPSARLSARLDAGRAGQDVEFELTAQNWGFEVAWFGVLKAKGTLSDLFESPRIRASAQIERGTLGGIGLSSLSAEISGSANALDLGAQARGTQATPFDLQAAGVLAFGTDEGRLTVRSLQGRWASLPVALQPPCEVSWGRGGWRCPALDLTLGRGRLAVQGVMDAASIELSAQATALPLTPLAAWAGLPLDGEAQGQLHLRGDPTAPSLEMLISVLLQQQVREGEDGLSASLKAEIRTQGAGLAGTVVLQSEQAGDLEGRLFWPARIDLREVGFIPGAGEISGQLQGDIDLALVSLLVRDEEQLVSGRVRIDASLAGQTQAPKAFGSAKLLHGRYEHTRYGIILSDANGVATLQDGDVLLGPVTAGDGNGGSVRITGNWAPLSGDPAVLEMELDRARLLRNELAGITATGPVKLTLLGADGRIESSLTIIDGHLDIPDQLPSSVSELDIREINLPDRGQGSLQQRRPFAPLGLSGTIKVPGRFLVRGRGLDAEFRGALELGGTSAEPSLGGNLNVVRGQFRFLDRLFAISEGSLRFTGAGVIPDLDVSAVATLANIEVKAMLNGPANAFTLRLESTPSLPTDEIMARVLFGRSLTTLSPMQAIQLASALRQLSGSGTGLDPLGTLRSMTGLDQLDVSESATGKGMRVGAGKYVDERVYLELQHDLETGEDNVSVDVEVTPDIGLHGQSGRDNGGLGLYWKRDY